MTDYVKSLDINRKDPHELTRDLFYGIGFAAIRTHIRFEDVRVLIRQIKSEQLILLPDSPDLIEKEVREMIPFELPIERNQTGPSVRVLRKIFSFEKLSDEYFTTKTTPLPDNPKDLNAFIPRVFPLTV